MKPIRVAAPASLPVTLEEVKKAARVDFDDDDQILRVYLEAAIDHLEGWSGILGRAIINQDWRLNLTHWPSYGIVLPFGDVSASTVKYVDPVGTEQVLPGDAYEITETATGSLLRFRGTFGRPSLINERSDAVQVTFTTGYGADASKVPASIKVAVMLLACHWYENREATTGNGAIELPLAVNRLIAPHRRVFF